MSERDIIYVTGHRHPDTDSVAAAIAYAFFKKTMGQRAVACRLGALNAESKYLLDRFGFSEPLLLTDARVRMDEIKLDPVTSIGQGATILEAMEHMQKEDRTYCGVVDAEGRLLGLVTKNDMGSVGLGDTDLDRGLLANTSVKNIAKAINGTVICDNDEKHLNGRVSFIAQTSDANLDRYDIRDRIVIIGNDANAQRQVIKNGAGLLIVVWTGGIEDDVVALASEHHCPIIVSGHGGMNTSRYLYCAPSVDQIMTPLDKLVVFKGNELAEDVAAKMLKSRYHVYPVVDAEQRLIGYASRYHIMNCENKQIIMVDHNEFSQSVRAIEKARVLEVIDHHRINDFSSLRPVSFRNEIVGSTSTIIATIFRENQIPIPQNLAGLLLGALLSDTMDFLSPTTTEKDRKTADILAALADVDLDDFARDMFTVTSNTEGKTVSEMINQDVKVYDIHGCKTSISQIVVPSAKQLPFEPNAIQQDLEVYAGKKQCDLAVAVFTSILDNGSVVYAAGNRAPWASEAFPDPSVCPDEQDEQTEEHPFQPELLSRKQQILPRLSEVIAQYQ